MKHIKTPIAALLASCLLMTGCDKAVIDDSTPISTSVDNSTQTDSGNSNQQNNSDQQINSDNSAPQGYPVISKPLNNTATPEELDKTDQIVKLLKDCEYVCWEMFPFDLNKDLVDMDRSVTAEYFGQEKQFYKVTAADFRTESLFNEMLDSIFTEERKKKFLETPERPFIFKDGDLYISELGAGGTPPFNKLVLEEVRYPEKDTIVVDFAAVGDKELWDFEEDFIHNFSVKFVTTTDGFRIDECNIDDMIYVCDNIIYNDTVKNEPTETEKIFKLLKDYGNLYFEMMPSGDITENGFADKSQKLVIEENTTSGEPYNNEYCKVLRYTEKTLNEKLDKLVTEDLKKDFLPSSYQIKDGYLYVPGGGFAYGMGQGMDKLYLNSIEYPDEKTILVNMTSFGDKTRWETEKDIEENFTVKLVRTDDGLRIAECGIDAVPYLYYYHEIHYQNISFSF